MRKYDDITIIEDEESNEVCRITQSKRKNYGDERRKPFFIFRYLIAVLIFGALFGISKLNYSFGTKVIDTVKTAVLYDLDASADKKAGDIPVLNEVIDTDRNDENGENE